MGLKDKMVAPFSTKQDGVRYMMLVIFGLLWLGKSPSGCLVVSFLVISSSMKLSIRAYSALIDVFLL